ALWRPRARGGRLGGGARVEAAVRAEVGRGGGAAPERVLQQAEIVVRVGKVGIRRQRAVVRLHRVGGAAALLEQPGQIEVRDRIVRSVPKGRPIVRFRAPAIAAVMAETPEV